MKKVNCQITRTQVVPCLTSPSKILIMGKGVDFFTFTVCEKVTPRMDSGFKNPVVCFGHIPNAYLKPMGLEK